MELQNKVVSSEDEELILVDENDNEVGHLSKALAHDGDGVLHRAFSLFLFDDNGRLLLQRRAAGKRLWPGYWSNSVCGHPRRGESFAVATARRLEDELGMQAELQFIYRFSYQATFGDAGSEHELCSVFLGRCDGVPRPNATEIDEIRFLSASELTAEIANGADQFTPWFMQEWRTLNSEYSDALAHYSR